MREDRAAVLPVLWPGCEAAAPPDPAGALDHLICLLGAALEEAGQAGEDWQREHVRRTADLAGRLATALGLLPGEVRAIRWGAALHDIGKVRVPQAILQKAGALGPAEHAVILQHPVWGVELLAALPFLPPQTLEAVHHHHERWDGQGYPAGLRGGEIPLSARIVCLADVFEALTSPRPYKSGWPEADAALYLLQEAGRLFDPVLAPLFVDGVLGFGHLLSPGGQPPCSAAP